MQELFLSLSSKWNGRLQLAFFSLFVPSEEKKNKNNLSSFQEKKTSLFSVKAHFSLSVPPQAFGHGGLWEPLAERRPMTFYLAQL